MWWRRNPYEDEFFSKIEELGRKNRRPFKAWFDGQDRIYLPFGSEYVTDIDDDDQIVIEVLEDAGFEAHDYKGGYCRREGSNRSVRIGKVLNRIRKNELQELREKHAQGKIYNLRRALKALNKSHDEALKSFTSSPYRSSIEIAEFFVVISQNPHDIAQMSTGRGWESCMTLGSGSMHRYIFEEVKSGGFIAYLIHADDLDIERPIARIHVRRFEGLPERGATISIAKPESSVYGEDVPGFKEAVVEWIDEHQGKIPTGVYQLKGGSYSDTFKSALQIGGSWDMPLEPDELLRVYAGKGLEDIPYKKWIVTVSSLVSHRLDDDAEEQTFLTESAADEFVYDHDLSQYGDWRIEEDSHIEDSGYPKYWTLEDEDGEYINEPFEIKEELVDDRPDLQAQAAVKIVNARKGTYPENIILDIKSKYPALLGILRTKYPELFTEAELKELSMYNFIKFVKALPKERRGPHIQQITDQLVEMAEDPASFLPPCLVCGQSINPNVEPTFECDRGWILHHVSCPEVCDLMQRADKSGLGKDHSKQHSSYERAYSKISDLLTTYKSFRTPPFESPPVSIPEDLIQKLVSIPERTYLTGRPAMQFRAILLSVLSETDSDTPTVQDFYENLLPYWRYEFQPLTEHEKKLPIRGDRIIYWSNLGRPIARLGENGCRFIPFIKSRLEQIQADFGPQAFDPNNENVPKDFMPGEVSEYQRRDSWENVLRTTERYLHILDSIESGTGYSKKYRW